MCGLVGVAGVINHKTAKVFTSLLEMDTIRGPHSTGVLNVNNMYKTKILKAVGTPWELYKTAQWPKNTNTFSFDKVLMGHNRWATQGVINLENSHPFEFPTLIGAHNGTLKMQELLDDHENYEVDSKNIFYHLDKNGLQDTVEKLCGAFTLTWWDKATASLNIIRNKERPMFYAFSKDNKTIFWASEQWMIIVACSKHSVEIQDIQEVDVLKHYKFNIWTEKAISQPISPEIIDYTQHECKEKPKPVNYGNYYDSYYGNYSNSRYKSGNVYSLPDNSSSKGGMTRDIFSKGVTKLVQEDKYIHIKKGSSHCGSYVECYLQGDIRVRGRIFRQGITKSLWKSILEGPTDWICKVEGFQVKRTPYFFRVNGSSLLLGSPSLHPKIDVQSPPSFQPQSTSGGFLGKTIDGVWYSQEHWNELLEQGCMYCNNTPNRIDTLTNNKICVMSENYECIVCGDCMSTEISNSHVHD